MKESLVSEKSLNFAVRIVNLYKHLCDEHKEYVLSKQVLRSGTSVGANIKEALYGQSKADFTSKMSISLKEISETEYWLELLMKTEYLTESEYESIQNDCSEIAKMLTAIVKSSRNTANKV